MKIASINDKKKPNDDGPFDGELPIYLYWLIDGNVILGELSKYPAHILRCGISLITKTNEFYIVEIYASGAIDDYLDQYDVDHVLELVDRVTDHIYIPESQIKLRLRCNQKFWRPYLIYNPN